MIRILLFVLAIGLFAGNTFAQTCTQNLRLARSTYEQGRLHEIPAILERCLAGNDFSQQERVEAYKILTNAYIYLEEPELADQMMLNLLNTDHYFEINEAVDPAEFIALYNTFRTNPIYRVGVKMGVNGAQPNVIDPTSSVEISNDSKYKYGIGIMFGGVGEIPLNDKMTLHGELLYLQRKYTLTLNVDRGTNVAGKALTNKFVGKESQNWLSLPLTFEYKFLDKKFNPYVAGGFSIDYLLSDQIKGERSRTDAAAISQSTFEFRLLREKVNLSAIAAAGVKVKVTGGYFVTEFRYLYGITKVNSPKTAFANEQATWDQGYADPVFKLNSLSVTASYIYNIFDPKKKTHRR